MQTATGFRAIIATAACALLATNALAGVVPSFNSATATATHDAGTGSPFGAGVTVNNGTASKSGPWNPHTFTFAGGSTKAKAGIARSQSSTTAKVTFASGTGVDQTDPSHIQPTSSMQLDFNVVWDIVGGTFGPPIVGSFSVPVGVKVEAGGSATFQCEVHWDMRMTTDVILPDVRDPYSVTMPFSAGTHLTSFTAPAAPFSPSSITDGAGIDQISMHGFIRFEVNNDTAPALIALLGPEVTNQAADPQGFADWQELLLDFPELLDPQNAPFRYEPGAGFVEVPEPGAAGAILMLGTLAALRRRGRAPSIDTAQLTKDK